VTYRQHFPINVPNGFSTSRAPVFHYTLRTASWASRAIVAAVDSAPLQQLKRRISMWAKGGQCEQKPRQFISVSVPHCDEGMPVGMQCNQPNCFCLLIGVFGPAAFCPFSSRLRFCVILRHCFSCCRARTTKGASHHGAADPLTGKDSE